MERPLIMLNSLLKTRQNRLRCKHEEGATARKTCTLATAIASGYKASRLWATRTALCKRRSNQPLPSGFLLVETALNNFHPIAFWVVATFCHRQMVQNFRFHRTLLRHFVHQWGVYLGFTALRHNPPLNLWKYYSETELHLEKSCLKNARRALHDFNNPLHRGKGELLFAYDAAMAFQIQPSLTIKVNTTSIL